MKMERLIKQHQRNWLLLVHYASMASIGICQVFTNFHLENIAIRLVGKKWYRCITSIAYTLKNSDAVILIK